MMIRAKGQFNGARIHPGENRRNVCATHQFEAAHAHAAEPAGLVFDIMRYALHDGPGIRTAVFFKGCPLSCWWCHNPEGQSVKPDLMFFENRCLGCGDCIKACPHGAIMRVNGATHTTSACEVCGTCADTCPSAARKVAGRWMTVSEVMREIERDLVFWDESGGGVTFSGGEPLAQPRFLDALLDSCREKSIHTVVETCGLAKKDVLLELGGKVGLFLYDLKTLDPVKHKKYTGVPNDSILANLEALAQRNKPVVVRFPIIPEINDDNANIRKMIALLSRLRLWRIHLLPYHQTGTEKYKRLGLGFLLEDVKAPTPDLMTAIAGEFERAGFNVKVGG